MKYGFIIAIIIFSVYLCGQDSTAVYEKKLKQLRSEIGLGPNAKFDKSSYSLLVKKLDSLGVQDEQFEDGYEWGGGNFGFENYIFNNIDSLLSNFVQKEFTQDKPKKDLVKSSLTEVKIVKKEPKTTTNVLGPVQELSLSKNKVQKGNAKNRENKLDKNKKSILKGSHFGFGLTRPLLKGALLSNYGTFSDLSLSIRSPIGINIGPLFMSFGYERAKYSFENLNDASQNYSGTFAGIISFFDLGKIIKFGGENIGKYSIVGLPNYDHGSGVITGFDLIFLLGKLPMSLFVSSRFNIISFEDSSTTYWASLSAGVGIDIR